MQKSINRRASRKEVRRSLRRRLQGRRAVLTTLAASVVAALAVAGIVPALAADATPTPTSAADSTPAPSAPAVTPTTDAVTPSPTPDAVTPAPTTDAVTPAPSTPTTFTPRFLAPTGDTVAPLSTATTLASSTTMDVVVRKRALANPTTLSGNISSTIGTDYAGTVGANFRLYTYTNYAAGPQSATGYTCTIVSGGQCTISIPNANTTSSGGNSGKRFWVVEEAPNAGTAAAQTYINPSLLVGSYQGPTNKQNLVGLTEVVAANKTITMPMTATADNGGTPIESGELGNGVTTAFGASFGAMANSWNNPTIAPKCDVTPLRISLVLDQSASIGTSQWTTFRNALVGQGGVLNLLRDANARVSILGFGTGVTGENGWHYGASGPAALPSNYSSLIPSGRPGGSSNATNWDAALSTIQAANAAHDYDMVLFITDGAPNYVFGGTAVSGYDVTLRSLEAPIYAANALKNVGTRVVAVGVGAGITGAGPNLRAVSGTVKDSDYFQTTDWDELEKQLAQIVQAATCQLPVEVSKTTISAAGVTTANAGGWQFNAAKASGDGVVQGTATQTTTPGTNGTANWTVRFSQPTGQTASVTLSETLADGWVLDKVQCRLGGGPLTDQTIVNGRSVTVSGLTTTSEKLSCVFTNKEQPKAATVVVDKVWTVKDSSGALIATYRQPAQSGDAPLPAGLSATPTIAGSEKAWGTVNDGFTQGQKVALSENAAIDPTKLPGCTLTSKTLTSVNGAAATAALPYDATLKLGANSFTITNVVTCAQTLTLVKKVSFGSVAAGEWTLNAQAPAGALAGPKGKTGTPQTTAIPVSANKPYALSESGGPATYTQVGDWSCVDGAGAAIAVTGGSVSLAAGTQATCTVTNATAKLTLLKHVTDASLKPGDWTITGKPSGALPTVSATGSETASAANTFEIAPNTAYTISEALTGTPGTIAYRQLGIEQLQADGSWKAVTSDQVVVAAGTHATYRFVNDKVPAVVLPLTGGTSTDAYLYGGVMVLLLAGMLAALLLRRSIAIRRA
jgi:hypothetical protein